MHRVPTSGPSPQNGRPEEGRGARRRAPGPARPRAQQARPSTATAGAPWRGPAGFAAAAALLAGFGQACSFPWDDYDPRLTSSGTDTTSIGAGAPGGTGGMQTTTSMGGMGGAGAGTMTTGGTETGGGGTGGAGGTGGMPAEPCGKTDVLADDFEDGLTGVPWYWIGDPGAAITETNGEGVVTLPANAGGPVYGAFQTKRYYDLHGSSVSVKVGQAAAAPTASTFLVARYDQSNYAELSVMNGKLLAVRVSGGSTFTIIQVAYDPVMHRYWRFRHSNGTLYWETSPNGTVYNSLTNWPEAGLFDLSSVRIDMGGRVTGGEGAPSEIHFDDVNGEIMVPGKWCPASSLKDGFDDGTPGRAWLRSYDGGMGGCTLSEESGALVVKAPAGQTSYCAYQSSSSYDLTESAVLLEVPSISDTTTADEVFLRLEVEGEGNIEITQSQSKLEFRRNMNGSIDSFGAFGYSPAMHWWRISQQGPKTLFEYSADAQTWDSTSVDNPLTLTAVDIVVGAGTYQPSATSVEAHFDNMNLPP